jgi:hypothetical protein
MKRFLFLCMSLSACGQLPTDNRTPEQITASGHQITATCTTANGPGYTGRVVQVAIGQDVLFSGTVAQTSDCQFSFSSSASSAGK